MLTKIFVKQLGNIQHVNEKQLKQPPIVVLSFESVHDYQKYLFFSIFKACFHCFKYENITFSNNAIDFSVLDQRLSEK